MALSIRFSSSEDAFKKILWAIRVFGMLPLDCQYQPKLRMLALSGALVLLLTLNSIYWTMLHVWIYMDGVYHYYLYILRKFFETLTIVVVIGQFFTKSANLRAVIRNMKALENDLSVAGHRWDWSLKLQKYLGVWILSAFMILSQIFTWKIEWLFIHVEHIFAAVMISQLFAFQDLMEYCLEKICTTKKYKLYPKLYDIVHSSWEHLNRINGLGVFAFLSTYFIGLIHQLFQLLNIPNMSSVRYFSLACLTICYVLVILFTIFACCGISIKVFSRMFGNCKYKRARKFNTELYNILVQSNDPELYNYEEILFHFEQNKEFEFTASGFFPVNKKLICSMIITATTYLVILLEYSPSGGTPENALENT